MKKVGVFIDGLNVQTYLNEYGFRYNHRNDEVPMFQTMLSRVEKA